MTLIVYIFGWVLTIYLQWDLTKVNSQCHFSIPQRWSDFLTLKYSRAVKQLIHSPFFSTCIESMEQSACTDIQSYCFTIGWWWRERCVNFVIFTEVRNISDEFMMSLWIHYYSDAVNNIAKYIVLFSMTFSRILWVVPSLPQSLFSLLKF